MKDINTKIEYDSNMISHNEIDEELGFQSIRTGIFDVYGLRDYKTSDVFDRLPSSVAECGTEALTLSQLECAGARIRFTTDSKIIALKAVFERVGANARTPLLGIAGFDLYVDYDNESRFYKSFIPPMDIEGEFTESIEFDDNRTRSITIYFPYHSIVKDVYIGLEKNAETASGKKYKNELPVVFYGSSITHGSCASRPGMIYENILSRRLNIDYINLGFGGSARGEFDLAEYMADLDMSIFVCDYDFNAPNVAHLAQTHKRLYDTIRKKNPTIPYIIISKPNVCDANEEYRRKEIIYRTYLTARDCGDDNIYYIDGTAMMLKRDWDDCFVDGIHPNDLGFSRIADAIEPVMSKLL